MASLSVARAAARRLQAAAPSHVAALSTVSAGREADGWTKFKQSEFGKEKKHD